MGQKGTAVATPNQVNLQVKVAEVNRTVLKSLGFNLTKPNGNGNGSHAPKPEIAEPVAGD